MRDIHFFEHFLQIRHNLKTINGQNNIETIINDFACKKLRRHETFRNWLFFKKHTLTEWQRPVMWSSKPLPIPGSLNKVVTNYSSQSSGFATTT